MTTNWMYGIDKIEVICWMWPINTKVSIVGIHHPPPPHVHVTYSYMADVQSTTALGVQMDRFKGFEAIFFHIPC